jgi:hypothetical protein
MTIEEQKCHLLKRLQGASENLEGLTDIFRIGNEDTLKELSEDINFVISFYKKIENIESSATHLMQNMDLNRYFIEKRPYLMADRRAKSILSNISLNCSRLSILAKTATKDVMNKDFSKNFLYKTCEITYHLGLYSCLIEKTYKGGQDD